MHHLDAKKTAREEARRQLHKNVASNIEQVLSATPHKAPTIRPRPSITKTIQVSRAGHCWRSRDELISDVLLWTPTYGGAKAGRPAQKYIQQLCDDSVCSPEDLPETMNEREKWRERERESQGYPYKLHDKMIMVITYSSFLSIFLAWILNYNGVLLSHMEVIGGYAYWVRIRRLWRKFSSEMKHR